MSVIFKDLNPKEFIEKILNKPFVLRIFKVLSSNKLLVRIVSLCIIGIMTLAISIVSAGITFGFEVRYSGKVIATVENASVFESAKNIAVQNVSSEDADKAIASPKLKLTLTVADKLDNARKLADLIIENTDDIVSGSALTVNGEIIACVESNDLNSLLEAKRTAYYVEGAENSASFVEDVKVESGYYLKDDIQDTATVTDIINGLQVKTVSTVVTDTAIAFKTQKVNTDTQNLGYYAVTTKGKNGLSRKTEVVESLNGEVNSRTELSYEIISEPVTQVITVGTAPVIISATEKANISSAGFICPLSKGKFVISAYYGDGRNHKGIDLAANRGVAIFAAASGKVTYAGYDGDYGYNVVIDHGNGFSTRYAHASALCVSKGQTVSQGDMIAAVGSTGYSTGNHLHFEVIVNGTRVNPAPYIGLN